MTQASVFVISDYLRRADAKAKRGFTLADLEEAKASVAEIDGPPNPLVMSAALRRMGFAAPGWV